ncbi:MAG: LPS assembly protein LptD [Oleiphilaceae bacterium]|nr:LPS assembly protein LptD [Oleiphilaceae bacterium]
MRFSIRRRGILPLWLCAPLAMADPSHCSSSLLSDSAPPQTHSAAAANPDELTLYAQQVYFEENRRLFLEGKVEMLAGPYRSTGERAEVDQSQQRAEMEGNIRITGPQMVIEGHKAQIDMASQDMRVEEVKFLNPQTGMRGSAALLDREHNQRLSVESGYFTTCEGEEPDWSVAAEKIVLDNESGFGTAKHARFEVLGTPVLYVPWFTFPIDDRRKTGFLYPTIGSANTNSGVQFSTPYYFNLAPNFDATLTPSFINQRGWHNALEMRHLREGMRTEFVAGFLERDNFYRDEQVAQGFVRPEGDRWGLSWQQEFNVNNESEGWEAQLQYAAVSDNDYLEDLNLGLYTTPSDALNRQLRWQWAESSWRVRAKLQQNRQLSDQLLPVDRNYQRLPEIELDASRQWQGWLATWHSQYVYFYRDNDDLSGLEAATGSRLRHQPALSYPVHWVWGNVTPRISLDHTDYLLQDYPPQNNHISRTLATYELDSSIYLDRNVSFFSRNMHHTLQPRLYYVYRDYQAQDRLPNFDTAVPGFNYARLFEASRFSGGDRVGDMNRLSIGIQTHWYDYDNGRELAQLNVGQMLHFEDRKVNLDSAGLDAFGGQSKSSSFYASELILRPTLNWSLTLAGLWDDGANRTHESWTRASYHSDQYDTVFNISHRFIAEDLEQSDISLITPLTEQMSLLAQWRFDLQAHRTLGTLGGVEFESCCWRVQVFAQSYLDDESEIQRGIQLRFSLKGLGGFGADIDGLDQQIPGYAAREELIN